MKQPMEEPSLDMIETMISQLIDWHVLTAPVQGDELTADIMTHVNPLVRKTRLALIDKIEKQSETFVRDKMYTVVIDENGTTEQRMGNEFIEAVPTTILKQAREEL